MRREYILLTFLLVFTGGMIVAAEQKKKDFSYADFDEVLKKYVDQAGMVNYKKLKGEPQRLEDFLTAMSKLDPNGCSKWNDKEKIAFWLNAYNAFTLKAIIDNYPIKPDFFKSMYYPRNSIRQISGVWDKMTFKVMAKDYTLEHIEHKILRKDFDEPRIHMALVCAAMGCPPLRNERYTGEKLDEQLDDQSKKFLANPKKFRFDPDKRILHISPIFKWFNKDFVAAIPEGTNCAQYGEKKVAILEFVSKYLPQDHPCFSQSIKAVKIKYLDYDWSLNEQPIKGKKSNEPGE